MLTWLVTGAGGFLGREVRRAIMEGAHGPFRVVGLDRRAGVDEGSQDWVVADLECFAQVEQVAREVQPDLIIHAAGRTPPADACSLYRANTLATHHLLAALRGVGKPARVVLVGSAAELGPVPVTRLPIREDCPCRPKDAYGLSKWCATRVGLSEGPPLEVVVGRIFNLVGPGLPAGQAFGRFSRLLLQGLNDGDGANLRVGPLDAKRDFVDVRDAARALVSLALRGRPGTLYNIATGKSRSIGSGLDELIRLRGGKVAIEVEPGVGAGVDDSRADISLIQRQTGWSPAVRWEESLRDLWLEAAQGLGVVANKRHKHVA